MSLQRQLQFSQHRGVAIDAVRSIAEGRGWCNVAPLTEADIGDTTLKFSGLWANSGVPVATFVTAPVRDGVGQPSSLGVLHSRRRLGIEQITLLLGAVPFTLRQDHNQRGLILEIAHSTPEELVLEAMCSLTIGLCDYETTGAWRLDLYTRD
jgi:hypothetical protein